MFFAAGKMTANQAGMVVVADEYEIECGPGVGDPDVGLLGGGFTVVGNVLDEAGYLARLSLTVGIRAPCRESQKGGEVR